MPKPNSGADGKIEDIRGNNYYASLLQDTHSTSFADQGSDDEEDGDEDSGGGLPPAFATPPPPPSQSESHIHKLDALAGGFVKHTQEILKKPEGPSGCAHGPLSKTALRLLEKARKARKRLVDAAESGNDPSLEDRKAYAMAKRSFENVDAKRTTVGSWRISRKELV